MKSALAVGISAALLMGGWIALPRLGTPPVFATEVESAIQHANTWHFVGWRRDGGRKLKWEIWGRRQPFFYREQVGDDVLIDNGTSRLRLLPPDPFQEQGYAVALPSQRLPMTAPGEGPQAQFIEGIGGDTLGYLTEMSRQAHEITFGNTVETGVQKDEAQLTINEQSHLPVRYRLERSEQAMLPSKRFADSYGPPRTAAELTMQYEVTLPEAVMHLSIPAHFQPVDASAGLVLRPRFLGRNAKGALHVKIEHWLCGKRLVRGKAFPWFNAFVNLQCPPYTQPVEAHYPTDDQGRRYRPTWANPSRLDGTDFWLEPLEPIAPHGVAPRMLEMPVVGIMNFDKGAPDPYVTVIWNEIPIFRQATLLSVPCILTSNSRTD